MADGYPRNGSHALTRDLRAASENLLLQVRQRTAGLRQSGASGSQALLEELSALIEEIEAILSRLERRPCKEPGRDPVIWGDFGQY